jgi:hypothetical protein
MSDAEEATVRVGEVLDGKYEVVRLIGKGGMGAVVEARHLGLGEPVALKILHPRYLDNVEAVARFQQEARAAVQIRGEHSARLLDVGTAPTGAPFLVMELLTGQDLQSLCERGMMPVEEAVLYILQACEGMAEVHAHGIVHRDLKPSNLFLSTAPDGSPLIKVLDFGIAKNVTRDPAIGTLTMTLVALGTPLYMAPEQIRSSRTVDARADVWSLGAILYELLAGRPAFGGNTVAHITAQVLEAEPPPIHTVRSDVPAALDAAVRRALAKDLDRRWIDVAAFAAAIAPFAGPEGEASAARTARILSLGVFASDTPLASTLASEGPGTRRIARRSRGGIAAVVGVVVAMAAAALVAARPEEPARVVARTGMKNAALVRFAVASTGARYDIERASAVEVVATAAPTTASPGTATSGGAAPAGAPASAWVPQGPLPTRPLPTRPASDDFDPLGSRK